MTRRPPRYIRTDTLFPYTTLFRSVKNNSLEVLEHLGVMDRILPLGTQLKYAQIRFADGRVKQQRALQGDARVHTFPRQVLIEGLRDAALAAGVDIVPGSRVQGVRDGARVTAAGERSEEHTSELQS